MQENIEILGMFFRVTNVELNVSLLFIFVSTVSSVSLFLLFSSLFTVISIYYTKTEISIHPHPHPTKRKKIARKLPALILQVYLHTHDIKFVSWKSFI